MENINSSMELPISFQHHSNPAQIRRSWAWCLKNRFWVIVFKMMCIARIFGSRLNGTSMATDNAQIDDQKTSEFMVSIRENDFDEEEPCPCTECEPIESGNTQIQPELTSIVIEDNQGSDGQQNTSRALGDQNMLDGTEEDEDDTTSAPPIPTPTSMPESTISMEDDEEELAETPSPTEFELPIDKNQPEPTSVAMDVTGHNPSILTRDVQHNTRFHYYWDPNDVIFWLSLYASPSVPLILKFWVKHDPLTDSCFKISIALIVMAAIIHIIHECLKNSNPSTQNLSQERYKILKYVCYVLRVLALVLLFLVFLTSNFSPTPSPPPPSHLPPHHHHPPHHHPHPRHQ